MVGYEIRNTHTLPRAHDYDKDLLYKLKDDTEDILEQVTDLSLNVPILDQSGLIPASYLPSYVDDVLEYPSYNSLPTLGETGKIYVTTDTDLTYRWSGSTYIEISKSIVTGVKGGAETDYRIGNINITAANIGLANVANIDLSKAIKTITRSGTTFTYTCLDGTTGTFTQQDENTWRPLGTGANDACAGNDSRLSNSRPASDVYAWAKAATKPSYSWSEITSTPTIPSKTSLLTNDSGYITSSGSCNYASSAGNADTVDSIHADGLVKCYRGVDQSMATSGYWCAMSTQTGIDSNWRHVISMDWTGNDVNNWVSQLSIPTNNQRGVYYRSKNGTNISSVGWRRLLDTEDFNGTISWSNVTSKPTIPTKTSLLTNDSGYITSGSYLPLSGGTISGDLAITGKCTNTAGAGSAFRWGGSGGPHYIGNNGTEAYFYSGNSLGLGLATGGSWRLYITNGGSVGIATTSPPSGYKLYVNGSAGGSSPWGNASDMNLKNVVGDIDTTFELIVDAPIFKYKWKDTSVDDNVHIGTSALYWKEIAKEITNTSSDDIVSMEYGTAALVASIVTAKKVKEQETKIQTLEQEIELLKAELNNLKNK